MPKLTYVMECASICNYQQSIYMHLSIHPRLFLCISWDIIPPFKESNKPNAAACSKKITVKVCNVIIITNILRICDNQLCLRFKDTTYFIILHSSQLFTSWHLYRALTHQEEATTTTTLSP